MEGYLQHSTRRATAQAVSPSKSSCASPDHPSVTVSGSGVREVFEAIPITRALHRLEDSRVCNEPMYSLTPEEIEQFREEWDIP